MGAQILGLSLKAQALKRIKETIEKERDKKRKKRSERGERVERKTALSERAI